MDIRRERQQREKKREPGNEVAILWHFSYPPDSDLVNWTKLVLPTNETSQKLLKVAYGSTDKNKTGFVDI